MNNVPKHVIEDLIPGYLAGDVSDDTKALIEQVAQQDSEIAELIESANNNTSKFNAFFNEKEMIPTDKLELDMLNRVRHSIRKKMLMVAAGTIAILMVPLTAMNFTDEVNWGLMDFIIMAIMLMGAGLSYVYVANLSQNYAYKLGVATSVLTAFLLVWGNLAVGFIGSQGNSANLLYLLVFAVGIWQVARSKMEASKLAKAMYYAAITLFLVPFIALTFWPLAEYQDGSLIALFTLNTFFALLLTFSGLLFQKASKNQ